MATVYEVGLWVLTQSGGFEGRSESVQAIVICRDPAEDRFDMVHSASDWSLVAGEKSEFA